MDSVLCVSYFVVLVSLSLYGLHRSHLVLTLLRHRKKLAAHREVAPLTDEELRAPSDLPRVTVQLPLYNEATVAGRLLEHVAALDYPRDRLEVQVLDDSTDETRALLRAQVDKLAESGLDIQYIHRTDRHGYKAGALDAGLKTAKGELIAIFDADFVPQKDFLRALVPHFLADPRIGMVQTRWGHLNRERSLLTRAQALMLDGHHLVENRARGRGMAVQLFRNRRHVAKDRNLVGRRLAARHCHRRSGSVLSRAARRLEVHLSGRRGLASRAA
jgi:cellulose synthase/poly-beta-1,6-N-acetylglucosamine synthase-like glycosyltransferase